MIAVIRFPASNCDNDAVHALTGVLGKRAELVWHEEFDADRYSSVVLPGGFSYGDHLRAGIIAAFSPAMKQVKEMAAEGKPVLGICNGFQTLTESGLLPGALLRNSGLNFVCKWVSLKVENGGGDCVFTKGIKNGRVLRLPIAHNEGRYYIGESGLSELERGGCVALRYVDGMGNASDEGNPNGAFSNIAGVCSPEGNVMGLMPHPERASEMILGGEDGRLILKALE